MDISKYSACKILVVGDLMLDEYVWGDVERISPEAPVQVVNVTREGHTLGGSGNVVNNLVALGAEVATVGVIGGGPNGRLLLDELSALGLPTDGVIPEPDRATTRKTRVIAANQQVLRIDRESKTEISGSTLEALMAVIEAKIPHMDAVLISDYDKGLVCPALLARLTVAAQKHGKPTLADPKGFDFTKYGSVTLLTPNQKEAGLVAGMTLSNEADVDRAGAAILAKVDAKQLLITRGKDGMVLFSRHRPPYRIKALARQVFDVSGAGDTVLAVMGLAVAAGATFQEAAGLANAAAGIVVGKVGTATVSAQELSEALQPCAPSAAAKQIQVADLKALVLELRKTGRKIVLTNGCFDLLHAGHIMLLAEAKKLGQVLIVAIDDDDSVQRLKGAGRPVLGAGERVRILSALDSIDYVVIFESEKLKDLIRAIRPDVLAKGSNYDARDIIGSKLVEQFGGRVVRIPVNEEISSSRIIDSIKKSASST